MNERIVFTNPDGSVGVIIPTGEIPTNEVMAKDVPTGALNARLTDITALPADRLFRGAWDDSNPENFIGTDLVKAKEIAHELRRNDREAKMTPLDKEEGFVSTAQARKDAILVEKQTILDANAIVQISIDAALDEAELRTILISNNIL